MNLLLIEDEATAARRLTKLIRDLRPTWSVLDVIDSVEASVQWLRTFPRPDLLFMDIQLADGISFEIFRQTDVTTPVIFTTAYDEYTLKAFKVNSIDYLLKPIDEDELAAAVQKFERNHTELTALTETVLPPVLTQLIEQFSPAPSPYKERILIRTGPQLVSVPVASLAYLYSEDGVTFTLDTAGKKYILDYTIDEATGFLSPRQFFRISRKVLVQLSAIGRIHSYFNSRLKLDLLPATTFEVIVSRERVADFKSWLDS